MTAISKKCCRCKNYKGLIAFNKCSTTKDGYMYHCRECHKKAYIKNRTHATSTMQKYYQNNKKGQKVRSKQWAKNNKEKVRQHHSLSCAKRRVAKLNNGSIDRDINIEKVYKRDKGRCGICNEKCIKEEQSLDHIIPLSKNGSHTWDNVQLAHLKCNIRKGNRV